MRPSAFSLTRIMAFIGLIDSLRSAQQLPSGPHIANDRPMTESAVKRQAIDLSGSADGHPRKRGSCAIEALQNILAVGQVGDRFDLQMVANLLLAGRATI